MVAFDAPPVIKGFVELYCSQRLDDHLGENKATCFKPKGENTANSAANAMAFNPRPSYIVITSTSQIPTMGRLQKKRCLMRQNSSK